MLGLCLLVFEFAGAHSFFADIVNDKTLPYQRTLRRNFFLFAFIIIALFVVVSIGASVFLRHNGDGCNRRPRSKFFTRKRAVRFLLARRSRLLERFFVSDRFFIAARSSRTGCKRLLSGFRRRRRYEYAFYVSGHSIESLSPYFALRVFDGNRFFFLPHNFFFGYANFGFDRFGRSRYDFRSRNRFFRGQRLRFFLRLSNRLRLCLFFA